MANKKFSYHDLYLGCECTDLDHIAHLMYFDPSEEEKGDEDDVIYFAIKARSYHSEICPPIVYCYDKSSWASYFRFHYFRRIGIALKYIFNKNYVRKGGILDCFDFRDKDLPVLDHFLSLIKDEVRKPHSSMFYLLGGLGFEWLENNEFRLRFLGEQLDEDFPYWLSWELQFKPRGFFGRIWYAGRFLFGRHCKEQHFEIDGEVAPIIRGIIEWVQKKNLEEEENGTSS